MAFNIVTVFIRLQMVRFIAWLRMKAAKDFTKKKKKNCKEVIVGR